MIEAFWSRMQVELLDRHRWKPRVEPANAIFDYLEIFHNRRRRHSSRHDEPDTVRERIHRGMRSRNAAPRNRGQGNGPIADVPGRDDSRGRDGLLLGGVPSLI